MGIETSWVERHPLAAALDGALPGPSLVSTLAGLEPADLDDEALLEVVAAWERTASWASAAQGSALAELHRRREAQGRGEFVADEVAVRLASTRHSGETKVGLALALDRMPTLADALSTGRVDARKALVLADDLAHLPDHTAEDVARCVMDDAASMTAPRLRARLRRLELVRDPAAGEARHQRARHERHVELTPAVDSMAWLSAYLPAEDAVAVHESLTALADQAPADDPRSLGERRADALVDLAVQWLDAGVTPHGPLVNRQGRRPHLEVVASASTLLGLDELPAELIGYGPVPASTARRIAARATWSPLLVDARTGAPLARSTRRYGPTDSLRSAVVERDLTCTFPGCRIGAARCDLDHVVPFAPEPSQSQPPPSGSVAPEPPPSGSPPPGSPPGTPREAHPLVDALRADPEQTSVDNLQALCRHHHRAKTHAGWSVHREDDDTHWSSPTGTTHVRPSGHLPPPVHLVHPPDGVDVDLVLPAAERGRLDATRPSLGPPPF